MAVRARKGKRNGVQNGPPRPQNSQGGPVSESRNCAVHTCCRAHTDTRTHGRGWPHRVSLLPFHVSTRHLSHLPSILSLSLSFLRHLKATGSPAHSTSLVGAMKHLTTVSDRPGAWHWHATLTRSRMVTLPCMALTYMALTQAPSAMTCTTYVPTAACASNQRKLEPTLLVHFTAARSWLLLTTFLLYHCCLRGMEKRT